MESLEQEKDDNNNDNAKSVKNHIVAFQTLQQNYEKLVAKNSKLENEYKTLQQTHEKLIAESKLANSKVKFSSKHKVQPDKVSPRTVDINLSGPCRQDPLSALCASVKKEDDAAENSCTSDNESTDSDDSYPPSVSDDQDIDDDTNGYKAREFLTFYVGNLHYSANSYQVRKAVEKAVGFPKIVDQVVIAKTSTGESRGCAFVTICWKDHVQLVFDENKSNIAKHTRSYDKYLQVMFNYSRSESAVVQSSVRWLGVSATTKSLKLRLRFFSKISTVRVFYTVDVRNSRLDQQSVCNLSENVKSWKCHV